MYNLLGQICRSQTLLSTQIRKACMQTIGNNPLLKESSLRLLMVLRP